MSWSKCNKNCIITGPLDAFCLVCETHLKTENDLYAHFEKPIHTKNLESSPYLEKYNDHRIRKVKKGYYCEFCNQIFFTAAKVGLHIVETMHQYNRRAQTLKRVNNMVYAFDNVIIGEKEWNGFVDDTCTVCNTEFENEDIHKTGHNHTMNLILKKIEFLDDKMVYRRVDESSFHCMTCNLVLANHTLTDHAEQSNHVKNMKISRDFGSHGLNDCEDATTVVKTDKEKETLGPPTKINVAISKNENKVPNNNNSKATAKADTKKNEGSAKIPARDDIINPAELERYICNVLGAKNYVVAQEDGKSMCLLCDWTLDTNIVASHVSSRHHQTILKMHTNRLEMMSNTDKKDATQSQSETFVIKMANQKNEKPENDKSRILNSMIEFQSNDINVNFDSGVATCTKCNKTLSIAFDVIQSHIHEHKKAATKKEAKASEDTKNKSGPLKNTVPTKPLIQKLNEESRSSRASSISSTRDDEQIDTFAKEHNLAHVNGTMYCPLCESKLPTSLKNLKEHVHGAQHKSKLSRKNEAKNSENAVALSRSPGLLKMPTNQFITSMIGLKNDLIQDIIINEKFTVNIMSFLMITMENFTLKCQPCEMVLRQEDIDQHKVTPNHIRAMTETMVITSIDNEFIREPRPDVFHCGFCARVELGWDDFEEHLAASDHRAKRTAAQWRQREYMSQVTRHRWQTAMGFMAFMNNFAGHDSSDNNWF